MVGNFTFDYPLQYIEKVDWVNHVHRRTGTHEWVEADDLLVRILLIEPLDHVDFGADSDYNTIVLLRHIVANELGRTDRITSLYDFAPAFGMDDNLAVGKI